MYGIRRIFRKHQVSKASTYLCPTPPRNFVKIRSQLFQLSDGQTKTDRSKNITSFFGGGNDEIVSFGIQRKRHILDDTYFGLRALLPKLIVTSLISRARFVYIRLVK